MLPHTLDLAEIFHTGIHHAGQGTEGIQQPVGCGIGVALGNGIEQHQLQDIHRVEAVQSLLEKALLQALAMLSVIHIILRHDWRPPPCCAIKRHVLCPILAYPAAIGK